MPIDYILFSSLSFVSFTQQSTQQEQITGIVAGCLHHNLCTTVFVFSLFLFTFLVPSDGAIPAERIVAAGLASDASLRPENGFSLLYT